MALADGDVIRFEYTLYIDGEKKPLETSSEDLAKTEGIHREDKQYKPLTVTLGAQQIIPGLESHIRSHGAIDKPVVAELQAADAYGPRDASKIKDIPMGQFRKQKIEPQVGLILNFEGQRAVITRVAGGRVRLDMNHDLAGKNLRYEYTITEVVTDPEEKVKVVLGNLFNDNVPEYTLEADGISLEVPAQMRFDQQWPMHKFRVVAELRASIGMDKAVKLVETFPGQAPADAGDAAGEEE